MFFCFVLFSWDHHVSTAFLPEFHFIYFPVQKTGLQNTISKGKKKKKIPHSLASRSSVAPCPLSGLQHHCRLVKLCFPFTTLTSHMFSHLFPHLPLVLGVVCSSDCPSLGYTVRLPLRDGTVVSR